MLTACLPPTLRLAGYFSHPVQNSVRDIVAMDEYRWVNQPFIGEGTNVVGNSFTGWQNWQGPPGIDLRYSPIVPRKRQQVACFPETIILQIVVCTTMSYKCFFSQYSFEFQYYYARIYINMKEPCGWLLHLHNDRLTTSTVRVCPLFRPRSWLRRWLTSREAYDEMMGSQVSLLLGAATIMNKFPFH